MNRADGKLLRPARNTTATCPFITSSITLHNWEQSGFVSVVMYSRSLLSIAAFAASFADSAKYQTPSPSHSTVSDLLDTNPLLQPKREVALRYACQSAIAGFVERLPEVRC